MIDLTPSLMSTVFLRNRDSIYPLPEVCQAQHKMFVVSEQRGTRPCTAGASNGGKHCNVSVSSHTNFRSSTYRQLPCRWVQAALPVTFSSVWTAPAPSPNWFAMLTGASS